MDFRYVATDSDKKSIKTRIKRIKSPLDSKLGYFFTIFVFILLIVNFIAFNWAQRQIDIANERRFNAMKIAYEMRQTSDDLTKMVQYFAITRSTTYINYYDDIIAIRDGTLPRPTDYDNIYWDFIMSDVVVPFRSSKIRIPFIDLAKSYSLPEDEMAKLEEALKAQEDIAKVEALVIEKINIDNPVNYDETVMMLFNSDYIAKKAAVMKPLHEFMTLIDTRSSTELNNARDRATVMRYFVTINALVLLFLLFVNYSKTSRILGSNIYDIRDFLHNLGKGNFEPQAIIDAEYDSVAGWLLQTREALADLERVKSENAALTKSYMNIIQSSHEAIVSINTSGLITSWNPAAEALFGYRASEMIANSSAILIPPELMYDEQLIQEQQQNEGSQYYHYESARLKKDGSIFDVSISLSPIYDSNAKLIGNSMIIQDITQKKIADEIIWHKANFDGLTDLPNRMLFFDRLSHTLSKSRRSGRKAALIYFDLDGFKKVNDYHGHEVGDKVLRVVSERIQSTVRENDTVARLGGDEFAIIADGFTDVNQAQHLAEKVLNKINGELINSGSINCSIGASFGIALYPDNALDMDGLLRSADNAMYVSKSLGKNIITVSADQPLEICDPLRYFNLDGSMIHGIDEVGNQHREMISRMHKMAVAVVENARESELRQIFDNTIEYCEIHFQYEEKLMRDIKYPQMQNHIRSHSALIKDLRDCSNRLNSGGEIKAIQIFNTWIPRHFNDYDNNLYAFIKSSAVSQ